MSLPQPPEGILDQSVTYNGLVGWTQIPKSPGLWGALKARLTGKENEYGNYSSYVNISEADADKIIENMKKDPRGYPLMDQTSGSPVDWMDRQRRYQEWLVEAYLDFNPSSEDNSEVALIVNEVEKQNDQQPITIEVDIPSKSPSRRIIRAKRIKNTIKKRKTKDLASRMARAFDKRLDDLIDAVKNPEQSPSNPPTNVLKPKKQKGVVLTKRYRYQSKSSKSSSNFNEYLSNKIGSAFSLAAQARKEAKESGAAKRAPGFFLEKALLGEFGGDFIRRTIGTFSSDPSKQTDPTLTKGQRFRESISPYLVPVARQTDLFGQPEEIKSVQEVQDFSVAEILKKSASKIESSFDSIGNKLSKIVETKNTKIKVQESESSVLDSIADKLSEVLESIKDSNNLSKKTNEIKQQQLEIQFDIVRDHQSKQNEQRLEQQSDTASTNLYEDPYKDQTGLLSGLFSKAKDFLFGGDDDSGGGIGGDGGGGIDVDIDRSRRRRRRFGRTRRTPTIRRPTPKPPAKPGPLKNIKNFFGGALDKSKGILGKAPAIGKGILGKTLKPLAKVGGRLIPGVGTAIGLGIAADEFSKGNVLGGLMGLGSAIPGPIGWAFLGGEVLGEGLKSIAGKNQEAYKQRNDPSNVLSGLGFMSGEPKSVMPSDGSIPKIIQRDVPWWERLNPFKMSEGGAVKLSEGGSIRAMIGEAGPEIVMASNTMMPTTPMIPGMDVILGTSSAILQSAGSSMGPLKPYIQSIIGPLNKAFGKNNYALTTSVGDGIQNIRQPKIDSDEGFLGMLKKAIHFILGNIEDSGGQQQQNNPSPTGSDAGAYKELLDMIAGHESTSFNGYEAFNLGGSNNGYTAHGSGDSAKDPINGIVKPLTQRTVAEVMQLQAAGRLHATGRYQIIGDTLAGLISSGVTDVKPTDLYNAVTQDKLGIALIKRRLDSGPNVPNFISEWRGLINENPQKLQDAINRANAFYKANPTATAVPTAAPPASIPTPPVAPPGGSTGSIRSFGDSIAQGVADASGGRAKDHATEGHNPRDVLNNLRNAGINRNNTQQIVLSTGLSNNPSMKQEVIQQFSLLQRKGIPVTVLPVSNSISRNNGELNAWLGAAARAAGFTFASGSSFNGTDGIHPNYPEFLKTLRHLRLSGS